MKKLYGWSVLSVLIVVISALLVGCLGIGPRKYKVSGVIEDTEGNGLPGVVLLLEGADIESFIAGPTDEDGQWDASSLKGQVTITPDLEGWFFDPAEKVVKKASKKVNFLGIEGKSLTINVEGEGEVLQEVVLTPQATEYYFPDTQVQLTAVPALDWRFLEWQGDLPEDVDPTENPIIITQDESRVITAVFERKIVFQGTISVKHNFPTSILEENYEAQGQRSFPVIEPALKPDGLASDELIIRFDSSVEDPRTVLQAAGYTVIDSIKAVGDFNAYLVKIDAKKGPETMQLEAEQLSGVLFAEVNPLRYLFNLNIPNDPHYALQWHYPQIRLPQAWAVTTGDASVRIAVVDTGIDTTHPDLMDNVNLEYAANFTEEEDVEDEHGHGTHVSGTVGAVTNNELGVAGVNWNVEILPIKIFDASGRATAWQVVQGILHSAGLLLDEDDEPLNPFPADVVNLSLGGGYSELEEDAVRRADAAGTIVVAAAGNDPWDWVSYPAAHPEAIAVGAVGNGYEGIPPLAPYSSYGEEIDVVAPGGGIVGGLSDYVVSTYPGGYAYMAGTSMACPHVAGVIGLMLANGIPKNEVREVLHRTSMDIGDAFYFGHGLINAYWAVNDVREMLLIVGNREGDTINAAVQTALSPKGEQFLLELIPGEYQFIAWIDVNNNGVVDAGDYYAETEILSIEPGSGWRWVDEVVEIDVLGEIPEPEPTAKYQKIIH